jgi:hypothetical protein
VRTFWVLIDRSGLALLVLAFTAPFLGLLLGLWRAARLRHADTGRAALGGCAIGGVVAPLLLGLGMCGVPAGRGVHAEAGYRRAAPAIAALARFRAERGHYPDSLSQLVPAYLPASALAVPDHPQASYPLAYRPAPDQYALTFRYVGPGMNECTYRPGAASWDCSGHY